MTQIGALGSLTDQIGSALGQFGNKLGAATSQASDSASTFDNALTQALQSTLAGAAITPDSSNQSAAQALISGITGVGAASSGANTFDAFGSTLQSAYSSLTDLQANADTAIEGLAAGKPIDIHQAMIAMDQASIGMNMALQVRNKVLDAYSEIMHMQM